MAITSPYDAGTGFVHTAPGHGADDFEIWMESDAKLRGMGIDTAIPSLSMPRLFHQATDAPGFEGRQVITDKGDKGVANDAVIRLWLRRAH